MFHQRDRYQAIRGEVVGGEAENDTPDTQELL